METAETSQVAGISCRIVRPWARGAGPLLPGMSSTWDQYSTRGRGGSCAVSHNLLPLTNPTYGGSWKYARIIAMDGNFKAEHMLLKSAPNEVWLMDGKGFMVTSGAYKTYLAGSANRIEVGLPSIEPRLFTYPRWLSMPRSEIRLQQSPGSQPG